MAAVLGDQIAYGLSRWGGRRVVSRIGRKIHAENKIKQAEAYTKRWSGAGIFLSRWLITALGPWVNVASGMAAYPWKRFVLWDVLGEVLWVVVYVSIGYAFSNRVQAIGEILGNFSWVIVGLILTTILGWQLVRYVRPEEEAS
jgi:membrane protein DedA with SNARE-associated domain